MCDQYKSLPTHNCSSQHPTRRALTEEVVSEIFLSSVRFPAGHPKGWILNGQYKDEFPAEYEFLDTSEP